MIVRYCPILSDIVRYLSHVVRYLSDIVRYVTSVSPSISLPFGLIFSMLFQAVPGYVYAFPGYPKVF